MRLQGVIIMTLHIRMNNNKLKERNKIDKMKKATLAICLLVLLQTLSGCHLFTAPSDKVSELARLQIALDDSGYSMIGLMPDGTVHVITFPSTTGYTSDVSVWKDVKKITAGYMNVAAISKNGSVMFDNLDTTRIYHGHDEWPRPLLDVADWSEIVSVACGTYHIAGLKNDGTVVAKNADYWGSINALYSPAEVSLWTDIVAIEAGMNYTVGLRKDGTLVTCPALWTSTTTTRIEKWTDLVAISGSQYGLVGLRKDGTVLAACPIGSIPDRGQYQFSEWTDIIAVVACETMTVGLRDDGTVVVSGAEEASSFVNELASWTNIVAIDASDNLVIGYRKDGSIVYVRTKTDPNQDSIFTELDKWIENALFNKS